MSPTGHRVAAQHNTDNSLWLTGEPIEVREHGANQLLSSRIIRGWRTSKEFEEITRLLGGLFPVQCRCRQKVRFQFILAPT